MLRTSERLKPESAQSSWVGATAQLPPVFPPHQTHAAPDLKTKLPPWRTVREAIGDLGKPMGTEIGLKPPLDLHFGRNPTPKSLARYKAVPPGGNRFDLQKNAHHLTPACWIKKTSGGTDLFGGYGGTGLPSQSARSFSSRKRDDTFTLLNIDPLRTAKPPG